MVTLTNRVNVTELIRGIGRSETGQVGEFFHCHELFVPLSIDDPRRIAFDLQGLAHRSLRLILTVGTAFDVRQPLCGDAKQILLTLAMRAPLCA